MTSYDFTQRLGLDPLAGDYDYWTAYNSIYGNTYYDVRSYQSATVRAVHNYWGGGSPSTYKDATSYLDVSLPLTTDPWAGGSPSPLVAASTSEGPLQSPVDKFSLGILYGRQKQYSKAAEVFKNMVNSGEMPLVALSALVKICSDSSGLETVKYLETLAVAKSSYQTTAMRLLAGYYLSKGNYATASAMWDRIIESSPDGYDARLARFARFYYTLNVVKDVKLASTLLDEISTLYSKDDRTGSVETAKLMLINGSSQPSAQAAFESPSKECTTGKAVMTANLPTEFLLRQNYPNPFNPTTTINFQLSHDSYVKLIVYDVLGREVTRLTDGQMEAGYHSVTWNASNVSSGIYIYRLSAGSLVQVKRMLMIK